MNADAPYTGERPNAAGKRLAIVVVAAVLITAGYDRFLGPSSRLRARPTIVQLQRNLSFRTFVDLVPGHREATRDVQPGDSQVAPAMTVTGPDGRTVGFGRATQQDPGERDDVFVHRDRSSHMDSALVSLRAAQDGTYVLEVTGSGVGGYGLDVGAQAATDTELHSHAHRALRDVPMAQGAVHRYDVDYAREDDGLVRLRVTARSAPGARRTLTRPARLEFRIGDCGHGESSRSVRISTPDGRTAGTDESRQFSVPEPADGDYAVEVSPTAGPATYTLHVSFRMDDSDYDLQQPNCARTTVPAGEVHRWTLHLDRSAEVPLRIVGQP